MSESLSENNTPRSQQIWLRITVASSVNTILGKKNHRGFHRGSCALEENHKFRVLVFRTQCMNIWPRIKWIVDFLYPGFSDLKLFNWRQRFSARGHYVTYFSNEVALGGYLFHLGGFYRVTWTVGNGGAESPKSDKEVPPGNWWGNRFYRLFSSKLHFIPKPRFYRRVLEY